MAHKAEFSFISNMCDVSHYPQIHAMYSALISVVQISPVSALVVVMFYVFRICMVIDKLKRALTLCLYLWLAACDLYKWMCVCVCGYVRVIHNVLQ